MTTDRDKQIYRVTIWGGIANLVLVLVKFAAGIIGSSAAMIADAVHSLSDLATDVVVLVFVRIGSKPADHDHPYGHGKYETLATLIVGGALLVVGAGLLAGGVTDIAESCRGGRIESPQWIALAAALLSIAVKEAVYQVTARVGRKCQSDVVVANAWHHRTDAFSSVGTALGIGGALLLGPDWAVLDAVAAAAVSVFIVIAAVKILIPALGQLMERSLPEEEKAAIAQIVADDGIACEMHNLRTRRVGNVASIEMHLRMPGEMSLNEAHRHSMEIERAIRDRFGAGTLINIHIEPIKINGKYCDHHERDTDNGAAAAAAVEG